MRPDYYHDLTDQDLRGLREEARTIAEGIGGRPLGWAQATHLGKRCVRACDELLALRDDELPELLRWVTVVLLAFLVGLVAGLCI